jgi:hypothetical protein
MKKIIVCLVGFLCVSSCFARSAADLNDIYAKWKTNYAEAKINKMQWRVTLLEFKKPPPPSPEANMVPLDVFYKELIKDGNNILFRWCVDPNNNMEDSPNTITYIFDGKTTKDYDKLSRQLRIRPGTATDAYKINEALDCMLVTPRICPAGARCSKYELEDYFEAGFALKTIQLLPEMETILGYPCYVVQFGSPNHKAWFAPDLGMLPLKYYKAHPQTGFVFETVDVQKVNPVKTSKSLWWYAEISIHKQAVPGFSDVTSAVRVLDMEPEYPISQDTFNPKLPAGTHVVDRIKNVTYVIGLNQIEQLESIRKLDK